MFDKIVLFWRSLLSVFVRSDFSLLSIYHVEDFGQPFGNMTSSFAFSLTRNHLADLLAWVSLIGLSVFLFYQVYKLIHAFVGGFYE